MGIKQKILLAVIAVLAGLGAVVYTVILPTLKDIRGIAAAINNERSELEVKYERGQRIRKIATEYRKIIPLREQLNSIFIPYGDELRFFTALERLERENAVDVAPSTDPGFTGAPTTAPIPLALSIRGDFTRALKYLIAIERLPYYYDITSVAITTVNPEHGDITMVTNGQIFQKQYKLKNAGSEPVIEKLFPAETEVFPVPTATTSSSTQP